MKFTGTFTGGKFDVEAYKVRVQEHLRDELLRITEQWLYAVTDLVPIWSGMSQGSLSDVAELVGIDLIIKPREGIDNKTFIGSMQGYAILDAETVGKVSVEIQTTVPHYVLQEYENVGVSKSAPWGSFAAGADIYISLASDVKLPKLTIQPKKYNV